MNLALNVLNVGVVNFDVDILNPFRYQYIQKVEYSKNLNSKTTAYNYGSLADKWVNEITIQDTKENMELISQYLINDVAQCVVTLGDGEQIFGAGIDYTEAIQCNIINSSRQFSQDSIALSTIKLTLEAIKYNVSGDQLKYRLMITSGFPAKLNFQTPIDRTMNKRQSSFQSENFGAFGNIWEKNVSVVSSNYDLSLVFDQTEAEMAQIEKHVSVQRTNPFFFSEADIVYLFPDQLANKVMITGFIGTRVNHNNWRCTLKMVTNV